MFEGIRLLAKIAPQLQSPRLASYPAPGAACVCAKAMINPNILNKPFTDLIVRSHGRNHS